MVSMILGIWFYINADLSYAIICSALSGALYSFFYYNVFSKKYKIFLGDTGSMIIGFLLAVIIIHFLNVNYSADNSFSAVTYAPSLALALLFIPIFDTIRICIVRIKNGKSVFKADSNHVHHRVLRLSNTHLKATLSILFINVIIITLTYLFNDLGNRILIFLLIVLGVIFSLILGSE